MPAICGPEDLPLHPVLFEALCRATVKRMDIPSICRLRRCGRKEECTGKLKPREIPPYLRGLADVDALLPACIAGADDAWFRAFVLEWILCREDYFGRVRPPEAVPQPALPLTSSGRFPSMSMRRPKNRRPHRSAKRGGI